MSSVLDALQKAERERRSGEVSPVFADLPPAAQRSTSVSQRSRVVPFLLSLVLVVNLGLLCWLAIKWSDKVATGRSPLSELERSQPAPLPISLAVTASPNKHPPQIITSPSSVAGDRAQSMEFVEHELPRMGPDGIKRNNEFPVSMPRHPVAPATAAIEKEIREEGAGNQGGPYFPPYSGRDFENVAMGAHIYSDQPQRRLIMLGGMGYREGSAFANGWTITAIGRDALVVSRAGKSYKLALSLLQ